MLRETVSWMRRAHDAFALADMASLAFPPALVARLRAFSRLQEERHRHGFDAEADVDLDARDPEFVALMVDFFRAIGQRWFRFDVTGAEHLPATGPALLVSNHSGGVVITDTFLTHVAVFDALGRDRALHALGHDFAVDDAVLGPYARRFGVLRAHKDAARKALAAERLVLVYPGSDKDTFRPWRDRHKIELGGRRGFVRLAREARVPIIPVVSAGTHEQLVVLSRGERLARALRTKRWLRTEVLPVTLSIPWGVTVGFVPYVPLPVQTTVAFGAPIHLDDDDGDDEGAVDRGYHRVAAAMQSLMATTVAGQRAR
ncbi:MAG: glycerol acyltransferase [Deltaproteobacteria bacterium]|nr:glycerol acyltransferase [Deltaproteobacteria bacterium]